MSQTLSCQEHSPAEGGVGARGLRLRRGGPAGSSGSPERAPATPSLELRFPRLLPGPGGGFREAPRPVEGKGRREREGTRQGTVAGRNLEKRTPGRGDAPLPWKPSQPTRPSSGEVGTHALRGRERPPGGKRGREERVLSLGPARGLLPLGAYRVQEHDGAGTGGADGKTGAGGTGRIHGAAAVRPGRGLGRCARRWRWWCGGWGRFFRAGRPDLAEGGGTLCDRCSGPRAPPSWPGRKPRGALRRARARGRRNPEVRAPRTRARAQPAPGGRRAVAQSRTGDGAGAGAGAGAGVLPAALLASPPPAAGRGAPEPLRLR